MNLEIRSANQATVTKARPLSELLDEDEPTAKARDGSAHEFDPDVLEALAETLSPLARIELSLPITFFFSHKTDNDCYVADDAAIQALLQLGVTDTQPRSGKLWMGRSKARAFAKEWPTIAQTVMI